MGLRIAVCDDEEADRKRLEALIDHGSFCCERSLYDNAESLLRDIDNGVISDIYFLDIFMKSGISGIEAAKKIRQKSEDAIIIFISSSDDFYRESFDLYAFNYMLKPIDSNKFYEVFSKAVKQTDRTTEQIIRFNFNNMEQTVRCSDLVYLASDRHVVYFYKQDGESGKAYGKLDDYVKQLPAGIFVRCHQSYVVNLKKVTGITSSEFMIGRIKIPISRKYSASAHDIYCRYMFGG